MTLPECDGPCLGQPEGSDLHRGASSITLAKKCSAGAARQGSARLTTRLYLMDRNG